MRRYTSSLWAFNRDTSGSIAIVFAISILIVLSLTGLAVDYGRALLVRSQLQAATDAAALNAVRTLSATAASRQQAALASFNATYTGQSAFVNGAITPTVSVAGGTVTVGVSASVPTTLASLLTINQMDVSVQSTAQTTSGKQLELAMMIDLTGSMGAVRGSQTKIAALKDAAADLLSILFPGGASSSDSVRVAVAPFADYVNAGPYASAATGLPTLGTYNNLTNLKSTKQSTFRGTYTGAIGGTAGSQCGATSPTSSAAGATFANGHCSVSSSPPSTVSPAQHSSNGNTYPVGYKLSANCGHSCNPAPPAELTTATNSSPYYKINMYDNYGSSTGWRHYSNAIPSDSDINSGSDNINSPSNDTNDRYIPIPAAITGVTYKRHPNGKLIGVRVGVVSTGSNIPVQFKNANTEGGYMPITGWTSSGFTYGSESTSGFFLPVPESMNIAGGTLPQCTTSSQPSGKLITCVTERPGSQAYTGNGPAAGYIGAFNHGVATVSNYSEDGKCYVGGRELPPIIPLTANKSPLTDFFANATVGGATPGHIGTAWAWYLLSPDWSSVFGGFGAPTAYNQPNVIKAAVLMTDGEYNIHYQSAAARDQALALCQGMKDAGITVYTVGFGFSSSAVASASGSTEQRAKDLLQRCASGTNKYFFPYDGAQLREDFKAIGNELTGTMQSTVPRLTN